MQRGTFLLRGHNLPRWHSWHHQWLRWFQRQSNLGLLGDSALTAELWLFFCQEFIYKKIVKWLYCCSVRQKLSTDKILSMEIQSNTMVCRSGVIPIHDLEYDIDSSQMLFMSFLSLLANVTKICTQLFSIFVIIHINVQTHLTTSCIIIKNTGQTDGHSSTASNMNHAAHKQPTVEGHKNWAIKTVNQTNSKQYSNSKHMYLDLCWHIIKRKTILQNSTNISNEQQLSHWLVLSLKAHFMSL